MADENEYFIDLENLNWDEYYKTLVSIEGIAVVKERSMLLNHVQKYFKANSSFGNIDYSLRKRIAGIELGTWEGINWLYFGSMIGAGYFKKGIKDNYKGISNALNQVPLEGEITQTNFNKFIYLFSEAFQVRDGGAGLATATRLLAMKRPDIFICIDKQNAETAANFFNIPSNINMKHKDQYWEEIVLKCQTMPWWNSEPPSNPIELLAWQGRVAMLDCILYSIEFE